MASSNKTTLYPGIDAFLYPGTFSSPDKDFAINLPGKSFGGATVPAPKVGPSNVLYQSELIRTLREANKDPLTNNPGVKLLDNPENSKLTLDFNKPVPKGLSNRPPVLRMLPVTPIVAPPPPSGREGGGGDLGPIVIGPDNGDDDEDVVLEEEDVVADDNDAGYLLSVDGEDDEETTDFEDNDAGYVLPTDGVNDEVITDFPDNDLGYLSPFDGTNDDSSNRTGSVTLITEDGQEVTNPQRGPGNDWFELNTQPPDLDFTFENSFLTPEIPDLNDFEINISDFPVFDTWWDSGIGEMYRPGELDSYYGGGGGGGGFSNIFSNVVLV